MIQSKRTGLQGFTLLEMLVATTIGVVIGLLLVNMMGSVGGIWVNSNAKMASLQGGRAIVDFMSRDVHSLEPPKTATRVPGAAFFGQNGKAGLDPKPFSYLQFLVNAGLPTGGLSSYLPSGRQEVENCANFFGQMRGEPTANGDIWIVGYYLADDTDGIRRLYRVMVAPDADAQNAPKPVYKLFSTANGVTTGNLTTNSWLYDTRIFEDWDAKKRYGSSAIAEHVAGFWVEALDYAGQPIPWLSDSATPHGDSGSAPLRYDSAAHFYMPGGIVASALKAKGEATFCYLDKAPTSFAATLEKTLSAHRLPFALQITIVTTDDTYTKRGKPLPPPPALAEPGDSIRTAGDFRTLLFQAGQKQATIFTSTVELPMKDGL